MTGLSGSRRGSTPTETLALGLAAIEPMATRNIDAWGRRTSMRLEPVFGRALTLVGEREGLTERQVIVLVEKNLRPGMGLTAAVRAFLLGYLMPTA